MIPMFDDKSILITGGTGSFGKAFTKFLLQNTVAKRIVVFSRDELKQYHMQKESSDPRLRFFIGDVRDLPRLQRAFAGVDIVIHAAALKQVPAMEYNPLEAVKTNILGSQNVVDAAIDQGVKKVLLISTDKAVHPINLYGSTKLCAERLFISGNSSGGNTTRFSVARYGNVVGSRGSIIDVLLRQKETRSVQITDEAMTRFWINIEQALQLVIFALEQMEGGEIFIPKIPSMKLVDLFETLAPGVPREVVGLRPGEKIHELLFTEHEARRAYEVGNYFAILPEFHFWADFAYQKYEQQGIKMAEAVPYSSHTNSIWLTKEELRAVVNKLIIV